ncbi:sensor domain-containing diguanylate cyclase [Pararobbsia silviterrae]|uniref:Diguanylate cyclase n=1 Tax=Pararobbsia silviterrae TaxID=1792498 RepID=A0A494XQP9_9BURK|nr:diguanylate cyclase [Pararobbsia silviterrae]RKP51961.1 diguanylate cyclase [Pararobbsia silviterrae]
MTEDSAYGYLLESLPAAVIVATDGNIALANRAARRLLEADPGVEGWACSELVGLPVIQFVHELDQFHSVSRMRRSAMSTTPNAPIELRVRTCRENLRVVLVTSVSIRFEGKDGVLISALEVGRGDAIGDRLRRSEEHFRRLFENMQDVYYRTDANGIVQMVGPGVRRVIGYEPEEVVGRDAAAWYPNTADRDAFKQAIRTYGEVSDFPGQMVCKDGRIIDISISSTALYDEDGRFAGVEGIYRDVTERKDLERELRRLASIDSLTQILNRRAFIEAAQTRLDSPDASCDLTLLLLDIDYFKSINDQYGHATGDQVLVRFADVVSSQIRETDLFGRLGGEEFAIVVSHTRPEHVRELVSRVLEAVRAIRLDGGVSRSSRGVTVSIGAALRAPDDHRVEQLLDRADRALYQAKHGGRDRVFWEMTA